MNTLPDEDIVHTTRPHKLIFVLPIIVSIFGIIIHEYLLYFGLLFLAYTFYKYLSQKYYVTNKRVITEKGIIASRTNEMQASKIENVSYNQGIADKLFGSGTIIVSGTGVSDTEIKNIPKPNKFRNAVYNVIEN